MQPKPDLEAGAIVQISPESDTVNPAFAGALMVVTEVRPWGCQGYVQGLGTREQRAGQAYYRATWSDIEDTQGRATWVVQ